MIRFNAHFDGKNICPDEPVSLPKHVPLHVTVDKASAPEANRGACNPADVFDELEVECGLIDGPSDWSAEHDHYLFGAAKKTDAHSE